MGEEGGCGGAAARRTCGSIFTTRLAGRGEGVNLRSLAPSLEVARRERRSARTTSRARLVHDDVSRSALDRRSRDDPYARPRGWPRRERTLERNSPAPSFVVARGGGIAVIDLAAKLGIVAFDAPRADFDAPPPRAPAVARHTSRHASPTSRRPSRERRRCPPRRVARRRARPSRVLSLHLRARLAPASLESVSSRPETRLARRRAPPSPRRREPRGLHHRPKRPRHRLSPRDRRVGPRRARGGRRCARVVHPRLSGRGRHSPTPPRGAPNSAKNSKRTTPSPTDDSAP